MLGLYYVAPTGSGGSVAGYKLANLDRAGFDSWLSIEAMKNSIDIHYNVGRLRIDSYRDAYILVARLGDNAVKTRVRYIVAADGSSSPTRRYCYPGWTPYSIHVAQEYWRVEEIPGNYFYMMLLNPGITPVYGYVIPKDTDTCIIGVGVYPWQKRVIRRYLDYYKDWLRRHMGIRLVEKTRGDSGLIPFDKPATGKDNIVLVGDAAGLTNSFSGEGIRQAIESGIIAAESIKIAEDHDRLLVEVYNSRIKNHLEIAEKSRSIIPGGREEREEFVEKELKRVYY